MHIASSATAHFSWKLKSQYLHVRYTTVSQPDSVDGWLAVQLGDKLWFPCWDIQTMAATAARIIPIVTAQQHSAAILQPASPTTSGHLQPASITTPANGTSPAIPANDSAADAVTNASAVSDTPPLQCCFHALPCSREILSLDQHMQSLTHLLVAAYSGVCILHGAVGAKSFRAYEARR